MSPQFLIAGHIVKDVRVDGWVAGGGALYAAAQAAKLMTGAAVVTACEPEIEPEQLVPGVDWHVRALEASIRFENVYVEGVRSQRVLTTAPALGLEDIPDAWRDAPLVLLTPVFHDLDPMLPSQLAQPGRLLGIGAQGWLRRLEGDRVVTGSVATAPAWLTGDMVFLSDEDIVDPEAVGAWQSRVPVVALTRGRGGCTVWNAQGRHDLAPVLACERDPTGAGDVFATACLVRYGETGDAVEAARFGAAAASLAVEGRGIEAIGDREQIEARLALSGGV